VKEFISSFLQCSIIYPTSILCPWWCGRSSCARPIATKLSLLLRWFKDLETAHEGIIHAHHGTRIIKLSTIVGSTEQGHELPLGKEFVPILYNLMGSADQINIVLLAECLNDFTTKSKTDSTIILTPALNVFIRIRPKEIAQQSSIRNISRSHDSLDLL